MKMDSFATVADLEKRWRPLTGNEQDRAEALLADATSLIKDLVAGWEKASPASLRRVVCAMVKRAMATVDGGELGGMVTGSHEVSGPYSTQLSFANPTGDLYMTKAEKASLKAGGAAKAYSVSLIPDNPAGVGYVFP